MGRAFVAALLSVLAVAGPAHAIAQTPDEPIFFDDAFEAVASAATALELEPARRFPVRGVVDFGEVDARFGAWRGGHRHEGQDVFADAGTPIASIEAGRVVERGDDDGRGNYVAIWAPDSGRTFVYLHMRAPTPHAVGELVDAGRRIGAVGCTGSCWGDHLHLEMREGRGTTGKALDPLPLLRRLARFAR